MVENGFATGVLREQPILFLGEVIHALADLVLEMASRDPAKIGRYKHLGWEMLWGAIAVNPARRERDERGDQRGGGVG